MKLNRRRFLGLVGITLGVSACSRMGNTALPKKDETPEKSFPTVSPDIDVKNPAIKALVIYDSVYGNTEKIAQSIGEAIGGQLDHVDDVNLADINGFDLIIVGSPVHGGQSLPEIQDFLDSLPALKGIKVAAFDTRLDNLAKIFGHAAPKIAQSLADKGGILLLPPEGFIVLGTEGPLKNGELERAATWATQILQLC